MRYKKIVLSIIASVLCLGLLSGCGGYSHDFNSSEEAQKYVLAKLKDKYNEEVRKLYLDEKVNPIGGCFWSLIQFPIYH